ncbi:MAG: hypothetical protein M3N21_08275 [Actinomycetota bacterium]|nr:hypothetical protein [Actinomycetota bacterium]
MTEEPRRPAGNDALGTVVARLTEDGTPAKERGRLLLELALLVGARVREAGFRAAGNGRGLAALVTDVAPHLPVRDLLTLRQHHGGLSGDALAESLITTASRTTAAIGAVGGAVASAELLAPPTLLATPAQLVAETVAVVAVELKLVAELHVVFGRAPRGTRGQVAAAYLASWASRRGIDTSGSGSSAMAGVLGAAARQQLRSRLVRRLGRNLSTLAPFLAGALAGAEINRRETRSLGEKLHRQLRPH